MYVILGVIIFWLFLILWSALPLIKLKYNNDVAEYADIMTQHCYKNVDQDFLPENNTYIYRICTYLFDDDFKEKSKIKDPSTFTDSNKGISERLYMKLYKEYLDHSMIFFILGIFFLIFYIWLFNKYFSKEYVSFSLLFFLIFYGLLYIIIFSLILKKITEIYNDTALYKYYNLMVELNTNIKYYKDGTSSTDHKKVTISTSRPPPPPTPDDFKNFLDTILYNSQDAINSENYAKYIIINDDSISYIKKILNLPSNSDLSVSELLNMHSYFHSKKHKDEVKYRINVVTSFLYAYIVFIFFIVYFLFKILNEILAVSLVYIYACIVIFYFLASMLYLLLVSIQ